MSSHRFISGGIRPCNPGVFYNQPPAALEQNLEPAKQLIHTYAASTGLSTYEQDSSAGGVPWWSLKPVIGYTPFWQQRQK
jgi:hypothetical protein